MLSDTFAKRALFFACLGVFLYAPIRADSGHSDPMIVESIKFETKLGDGYWPCSFAPFLPDKPCSQEEDGRGYRYRRYAAKSTYHEYYLDGSGGHGWIDVSTYSFNDDTTCLGGINSVSHYQSGSYSASSQATQANVQMPPPSGLSGLKLSKTQATGEGSGVQSPTIGETWSEIHTLSNPIGITLTNPTSLAGVG